MLKIPEEQQRACYASGYFRRYSFEFDGFTIGNDKIHSESVIIKEAICEESEMKLGGCIASSCEFEVSETVTDNINLSGLRFKAYLHTYRANTEYNTQDIDNPDWAIGEEVGNPIPIGVFNVRSVEMIDDADYKKVTAYDDLYDWNIDVSDWYNNTFPSNIETITYTDANGKKIDPSKGIPAGAVKKTEMKSETVPVSTMRNALIEHLMRQGGTYSRSVYREISSRTYINDNARITKTLQTSDSGSVMGLDLLKYFCELAGGFGRINRYGIFEILSLGASSGLYPAENLYPEDSRGTEGNLYPEDNFIYLGSGTGDGESPELITTHYEEYNSQAVSSVGFCVRRLSEQDGVKLTENGNARIISYPANQGANPYITSNPLILDMTDAEVANVAKNIYETIGGIAYRPNETELEGVPYYEPGDYYNVTKKIAFESFIFSRTLTGVQGMRDIFSAKGLEVRENNITVYDSAYTSMSEDYQDTQEMEEISNTITDNEENFESVSEYNAKDLIRTVSGTSIEWDTNKWRIDEFGHGAPSLDYRKVTIRTAPEVINGHLVMFVDSLPDIWELSDSNFIYYYFDKSTGVIYEPCYHMMYTAGVENPQKWWRKFAKSNTSVEQKVFDYSVSDIGRTYLDEDTGKLWRLTGSNLSSSNPQFRWEYVTTLEKVTAQLSTTISQTAKEIRLEAEKTYAKDSDVKAQFKLTAEQISSEVTARQGDTRELSSRIVQTAAQIESNVSKNSDTWDTAGYNIIARGYGVDSSSYKDYASNSLLSGGYYLDEQTGYLYWVTGSSWITQGQMIRMRFYYSRALTRTTVNLSSQIKQSAGSIAMTVSGSASKETSAGITISLYDKEGKLLDREQGNIYIDGNAIFSNQLTDGTTTISGSNIKTGRVLAEYLDTKVLKVSDVQAGGTTMIDGGLIKTGTISASVIDSSIIRSSDLSGEGTTTINGANITTGSINASLITTGTMTLDRIAPNTTGSITIAGGTEVCGSYIKTGLIGTNGNVLALESKNATIGIEIHNDYVGMLKKVRFYDVKKADTDKPQLRLTGESSGELKYAASSSKRYKHDITEDIREELDPHKILSIPVKQYKYRTDYVSDVTDTRYDRDVIGIIAEDMNEIYPVACDYSEYGQPEDWQERYIVPPLLSLVQELYKRVEALETEIKQLKGGK